MKNKLYRIVLLAVISGCSFNVSNSSIIHIKGSDTMLLLTRNLSEAYMKTHPQISIYVDGGGTATGVKALVEGDVDICTGSRPLKPEEVKAIADKYSSIGIQILIAKDALSVYVNPNNPIQDLTIDQLKKIFTCQLQNWTQLNGKDEKIQPIIRPPNSGTHYYFKEHVLGGEEYCDNAIIKPTTLGIISEVLQHENAIGYGGIGYKNGVVHAKINGIEPTEENVVNNKYPISRYLHFYTLNTPRGIVSDFINWVVSPEGQKIVEKSGYISIWLNKK